MNDPKQILHKNLSIDPKYSSSTSLKDIYECFLCGKWIRTVRKELKYSAPTNHSTLTPSEVQSALQLGENIGELWERVLIQILPKENYCVFSLPRISNTLKPHLANNLCFSQLLHYVSATNTKNLWKESYQRFEDHAVIKQWKEGQKFNVDCHKNVLKNALLRLYKCPIIGLTSETECDLRKQNMTYQTVHLNIHPALFIVEGPQHFFVFFEPTSFSVMECLYFSPAKMKENEYGALFILYQLLEGMQVIQDCGLFLGDVSLHHLRLGPDFHLTVIPQIKDSLFKVDVECLNTEGKSTELRNSKLRGEELTVGRNARGYLNFLSCSEARNIVEQLEDKESGSLTKELQSSLLRLTQKWVTHEISNLDYLLCLSYFAGHSFESPAYYPILPWVTDFTSPNGGWRDLTKTKYRLNKGDQQLDHTYELAENDPHLDQIAHHIPEFFSEVTYYVYKARVTPKQILKKHVRQQFVASHYPSSIARMYALTPEECIPEFYCDSSIFKSIHDDLPDLEVPSWCNGVDDFLHMHRAALESNYVSRRLHHWIDLYYGYKLTGSASIKAKNVCLPLVDDHISLLKGGIVQLFNIPHPPKLTPSPFLSKSPPPPHCSEFRDGSGVKQSIKGCECLDEFENTYKEDAEGSKDFSKNTRASGSGEDKNIKKIELPINYNPLTSLNQVEMLYNFFLKTSGKLPEKLNKDDNIYSVKDVAHSRRIRDTKVLGCLIVQIFAHSRCRVINSNSSLEESFQHSLKILQEAGDIPKCIYNALRLIFQVGEYSEKLKGNLNLLTDKFGAVTSHGLPPPTCHQMLQPLVNIISFPNFFPRLSLFVKTMKRYSKIRQEFLFLCDERKEELFRNLTEKHIERTAMDLRELIPYLSSDGVKLILPYIIDLYNDPLSSINAAWHFTDVISQALGPSETNKHILPLLIKLFEADAVSKSHLKLFHQSFILQLMVRLRLKTFLKYFITPIIEGAGGYKAPMEGSKETAAAEALKQSKILSDPSGFEMEDSKEAASTENMQQNFKSSQDSTRKEDFKRRNSSIRSPSGAENDITDAENDTEIFVFEGGEDDDTLNEYVGTATMDMNDPLKSPVSDTVSLDEDSIQEGGGSIPSLCPSPHSPTMSGEENEEQHGGPDELVNEYCPKAVDSPLNIPIPRSKILGLYNNTTGCSSSLPEKPLDPRHLDTSKERNTAAKSFVEEITFKRETTLKSSSELDSNLSLAELCCENILWLSHRLGPVLTARHLTRNLLRMLSLCYLPESGALSPLPLNQAKRFSVTMKEVVGDENAARILRCLSEIADIYGEQVILLQYLSHITELVSWCGNKLNTSQEAGLIGAMTLLQHFLHKLSDVTFMDYLQETLIRSAVYPVIRLLSSVKVHFPNGISVRTILAWRVIDSLCVMVQRVGRDMSKEKLIPAITRFLTAFNKVHSSKWHCGDESKSNDDFDGEEKTFDAKTTSQESIKTNKEKILEELKNVFTPELAYLSYVPLCKLLGTKCMEDSLPNHDLLRSLCLQYDENKQADYAAVLSIDGQSNLENFSDIDGTDSSATPDVAVTGNRIDIKDSSENLFMSNFENSSSFNFSVWKHSDNKSENSFRHLRGNWLAYWEHEIGRSEHDGGFNFKQIKLQSFVGHTNSVKSVHVLDNENSFISCSKDKTVKLWSLRSRGDGNTECGPQWTYSNHKKSVFDVAFSEPLRLAASCDSTVHIWDPFTATCLKQLDSLRHSPVTVLTAMSSPSTQLITATTDSTLKFIDLRTCNYTHELKITTSSVGLVRCLATSDDSHLVAVAHSSGVISTLDLRTGQLLATWKPHEGEVLTLQWYQKGTFISSALDQTICVWSVYDNKLKFILKGPSEPVHLLKTFEDEVISGTTANRIGLHTSISPTASFSCTRLRNDTFKGVLTAMSILPLNRLLLLGADNGTIKLLC